MLVDLGRNRPDGRAISDDYIWVAGLPIAVARGSFTSAWVREVDSLTDCSKGGEMSSISCGYRHLVSDYQGKPVLSLDSSRRISGVAEYGPFGEVNTRYIGAESAHPYPNNLQQTLSSWTHDSAGLNQWQRLNFDAFDIEPSADSVVMKDGAGTTLLTMGGYHVGRFTTPWVSNSGGGYSITFTADSLNCGPGDPFCSQGPWAYTGVALRSIEYARAQSGATPWFPPLRFSGQYLDQETGLHENWNRFFEAESGRYLSPEPLLQEPWWVTSEAQEGFSAPTYAYARNNPISTIDHNGLWPSSVNTPAGMAALAAAGMLTTGVVASTMTAAPPSEGSAGSCGGGWSPPDPYTVGLIASLATATVVANSLGAICTLKKDVYIPTGPTLALWCEYDCGPLGTRTLRAPRKGGCRKTIGVSQ